MTLGGSLFIYNGIKQDYSFIEALDCLFELCDKVSVVVGGDDGTTEKVWEWVGNKPIIVTWISKQYWDEQKGREKLSYFSNMAIACLDTDYFINLQGDECIHESSFNSIREAIETGAESFFVKRINLWGSPYTALNVPQERKPVSTEIIRLAKKQYRCVDDAESIGVPSANADFLDQIRIYHTGFVRDPVKHLVKIRHIQDEVFLMDHDKRIDSMEKFDCWGMGFDPSDIETITEPLPKFIKQWAEERSFDPFTPTPEGYNVAVKFLKHIQEYDYISTHGQSTDGWSIVNEANSIFYRLAKFYQ